MRIVVVGGGIAGLAATRRLEALLPEAELVLLEESGRLGGKVRTEHVDGFVIEAAPDSFLTRKEGGVALCEELGLSEELIGRRPELERTFVRRGGELVPLPAGLTGMVPTNLEALAESALLTPAGRERLAAEVDVPAAPSNGDESIAAFVSRRLGREAYDALVEPLMTGIYGGDGERLSLQATFPQLRRLELEHGSLLRGLAAQPARDADVPPFVTLRSGMERLVRSVANALERTELVTGRAVRRLVRSATGYEVELDDGGTIEAAGVVVAVPAFAAAEILADLDAELAAAHAGIPYASSVLVTLAFREADVSDPLDGYGYLVPRTEGSEVLACTWSSRKWEGRARDGHLLIRVYAGRFGGRDLTLGSDGDLLEVALEELSLLGIAATPVLTRVQRWPRGMPQYVVGHLERLDRIDAALAGHPGLAVAGAAYRGVGIPDCIRSGEDAARTVAGTLARAAV